MWRDRRNYIGRYSQFFRIVLHGHMSLEEFYLRMFHLVQHHKWNLRDIEQLIPFEFDIYSGLLANWIKEENDRISQMNR